MCVIRLIQQRGQWTISGLLILFLIGVLFLLKDHVRERFRSLAEMTAGPPATTGTTMPSMKGMGMPSQTNAGAAQAYAMVKPVQQQLIGVRIAPVSKERLTTVVRAVGKVEYNEQRITHVNLRISGWIEDLFVDYTGQAVRKGQPLFTLYSPELVTAQEEYLLAVRARSQVRDSPLAEARQQATQLVETARDRLRLSAVTEAQIAELARRGRPQTYVTLVSPVDGYVIDKRAYKGMFLKPETTVYSIANLSVIWVHVEIYEYEAPFVRMGQPAALAVEAYPGVTFHGRVSYIYPYVNKQTRTIRVRLEFKNPTYRLKPDMYGTVRLEVDRGTRLAVPAEAVLDTGTRQIVFVVRGEGLFEPREVTLGSRVGSYYEVAQGLREGDLIVTSGTFLLDSESKLMASANMMGALGMGGIKMEQAQMGEMDMGGIAMPGIPMKQAGEGARPELEKRVGELTLSLSIVPARPRIGENRVRLRVTDRAGSPVTKASAGVTYTMPMPGMMPATVEMSEMEPGTYHAALNLGMAGQWDLTVTLQRKGKPDVTATFSVTAGG